MATNRVNNLLRALHAAYVDDEIIRDTEHELLRAAKAEEAEEARKKFRVWNVERPSTVIERMFLCYIGEIEAKIALPAEYVNVSFDTEQLDRIIGGSK